jgi:hypothetical protein
MANKLELAPGTSWLFLLAYSVIALAALLWQVDTVSDETSVNQWCVSAVSISVALSALAVLATALMKDKFVGTAIDGGLVRFDCSLRFVRSSPRPHQIVQWGCQGSHHRVLSQDV